jgi:2-dehydropantoate 2-reductase
MTAEPIAILGVGGVGGLLAVRTGALCIGTERSVAAIRERGLALVEGETTTVSRPEAVSRLDRPVSLLVVAVKSYDLEAALRRLDPALLAGAVVLPLLNGLEAVDAIRAHFDACVAATQALPVVAAGSIAAVEAHSPEPGVVVQRTSGARVTAASDSLGRERLGHALAPLRVPGLEVVVADGERAVLWEKAARLAVLAAATVASDASLGMLRADAAWNGRVRAAVAEACAVAAADGVALDPAGQWAIIEALPDDLIPSTARDARAGRPTELEAITGSVVRAGRRLGVATPVLEELLASAVRSVATA